MVTCVKDGETKEFRNPMYILYMYRVQSMLIQKRRTESNLGVTRFARIIFCMFYNKLGPPIRSIPLDESFLNTKKSIVVYVLESGILVVFV
jgi:hypothetical protein